MWFYSAAGYGVCWSLWQTAILAPMLELKCHLFPSAEAIFKDQISSDDADAIAFSQVQSYLSQ